MFIREITIHDSEVIGYSGAYEVPGITKEELFRSSQLKHGRCVKGYYKAGKTIGWLFERKVYPKDNLPYIKQVQVDMLEIL